MNNSPPFKRHSVGRTYPWQVAPQQSLLPFRFNNTKFKSVNYIYNLSKFPATFKQGCQLSVVLPNKIANYVKTLEVKTITDATASRAITQFGLERKLDLWKRPK